MHLAIIIPVYNEGSVIRSVIEDLPRKISGIDKITVLAVDDGSDDNSAAEISKTSAILIKHPFNMGVGAATITGLEAASIINVDIAMTFDGDGQHDPRDIARVLKPIINKKADIAIGTRLKNSKGMPWYKKIGNFGLNIITLLLTFRWTSDTQSGFKAFSKNALSKMELNSLGYEFCSEIIMQAGAKRLKIKEVPIKVIYSSYSKSKGQSLLNGVNIVARLVFKKIVG